ncbi:DNA glycosylase AlkZ-like family protein, partial [Piscinibacter sp.]|uniref:DNA glycosylase AlkZ-like family protein n=1 Tax=Piscinibacter sp. TaxID=1903157 RepID=UPI002F3EAE26
LLWGWAYRFEAYTPPRKRQRGYYALPLLWRDRVIGWGNVSVIDGRLASELGHVDGRAPTSRLFKRELDAELERMRAFLGL